MKQNFSRFCVCFFILLTNSVTAIGQAQSSELPLVFQLETESTIIDLDWNFDNTLLAFLEGDDAVSVINLETSENDLRLEGAKDELHIARAIAWRPTQNDLLIASNFTKIWDYSEGAWLSSFEFPSAIEFEEFTTVSNVDWHPDGKRFAVILRECGKHPFRPGARVEI